MAMILNALRWPLKFLLPEKGLTSDPATHKMFLAISLLMIVTPFFLSCSTETEARVFVGSRPLPGICIAKMLGASCPGCGMTRSFVYLTHGEVRESLKLHRIGALLYLYLVIQVGLRWYLLKRPEAAKETWAINLQHWSATAIILLLIANWFFGLSTGSNGHP